MRPVGRAPNSELYLPQCRVEGRQPRLLEVVEFEHVGHDGDDTQPENLVIADSPWTLIGELSTDETLGLLRGVAHVGPRLFGNYGKAVHVDDTLGGVDRSLLVLEPTNVRFEHREPAQARVLFRHAGREWDLPLTDFPVHAAVLAAPVGIHAAESFGLPPTLFITLSLAVAHNNFHSKLVAAVIDVGYREDR